jgi:hypothetical protein
MSGSTQHSAAAFLTSAMLFNITFLQPAAAQLGPCKTVVPTTADVNLFVSDMDRSIRWYRDNAGLAEDRRWVDIGRGGVTTVQMRRHNAGVTLLFSPAGHGLSSRQMLCLVLDGPPAPPAGSAPAYLTDPDGTSVELAPLS